MTLHLRDHFRHWLEARVRAGYPSETCGLLMGRQHGGEVEVRGVFATRNLNTERASDRFELDPQGYLEADQYAQHRGMELVGVWHSHPDHPSQPSATDRDLAWEGWSYLILSVGRDGVRSLQSWRLVNGAFEEEDIQQ